jgi:hypothetical protein
VLTISVAGKAVVTGPATDFQKVACGDLKSGMSIEVKGNVLADGTIGASRIQVEDEGAGVETEFSGSVSALGGTCPGITISVAGKTVVATNATVFDRGACGDIGLGTTVEVNGLTQSDGRVLASRVRIDN